LKDNGMKLGLLLLALIAAFFLTSVIYRFSREDLMVDRCLTANHGSFDYSSMSCDLENNHPYVPYQLRHPHDKQTALLAVVSLAVFLAGYRYVTTSDKKK
jgi:hypothetical protein